MILLLIAAFTGIALLEARSLIREGYRRELTAFSVFLLVAFVLSLLLTIGVEIPSPMEGIQYFIKDILNLGYE